MRIRILNTTFGLVVDGIVKPKSPKDPPFEVDEKLGLRIVREGIAEAVDGAERGEVQSESNDNDNAESAGFPARWKRRGGSGWRKPGSFSAMERSART